MESVQISVLFLRPHFYHFAGVAAAVPSSESEVPTHIPAPSVKVQKAWLRVLNKAHYVNFLKLSVVEFVGSDSV